MRALLISIWTGYLADLLFGDPAYPFHPVRLMGKEISALEKAFRKVFPKTPAGERAAGALLAVCTVLTAAIVPYFLLWAAFRIHFLVGIALESVFCWQILAVKDLKKESMEVSYRLQEEGLPAAKRALSMIVGREVEPLDEEGVVKAAVETVAENASDGCLAPLFYLFLFGPAGGFAYKAVNTMDSMIGYRNDKYRYFGTVAARMDDVLNFIPSRMCALLMLLCARGKGFLHANAVKIFRRDRYNHASPNSGQTESAMAGALGLQLGGDAFYFGKRVKKKTMGDALRPARAEDIRLANRLLYRTVFCGMLLGTAICLVVYWAVRFWGSCL